MGFQHLLWPHLFLESKPLGFRGFTGPIGPTEPSNLLYSKRFEAALKAENHHLWRIFKL
jgi:hypothetical protein